MTFVRSLIFNILFFTYGTIFSVLMMLSLPLPRRVLQRALGAWMKLTMGTLKVVAGVQMEFRGLRNLPQGSAIIVCKHLSAWETGIFLTILDDATYVLKKQLLSIPFYGLLLRKSKMIAIDRDGGASSLKKLVSESLAALQDGRQVVIFPEGTRSAVGDKLPYHPGVAAVYKRAQAPVIPVALNSGLFWPRRKFLKTPGRIILEYLEPM
ncbi:MAG TPA: 1-acyl-sn-glycerol-3-phosphate acyltransferase, partial [Rhodospirillales bacterium]|nr:1-acyl-sn-glycerol-3-phosphate acyltransferase [Rhodospirillales bacterium]